MIPWTEVEISKMNVHGEIEPVTTHERCTYMRMMRDGSGIFPANVHVDANYEDIDFTGLVD